MGEKDPGGKEGASCVERERERKVRYVVLAICRGMGGWGEVEDWVTRLHVFGKWEVGFYGQK